MTRSSAASLRPAEGLSSAPAALSTARSAATNLCVCAHAHAHAGTRVCSANVSVGTARQGGWRKERKKDLRPSPGVREGGTLSMRTTEGGWPIRLTRPDGRPQWPITTESHPLASNPRTPAHACHVGTATRRVCKFRIHTRAPLGARLHARVQHQVLRVGGGIHPLAQLLQDGTCES